MGRVSITMDELGAFNKPTISKDQAWDMRHADLAGPSHEAWTQRKEDILCNVSKFAAFGNTSSDLNARASLVHRVSDISKSAVRYKASELRAEFDALAKKWSRDTKHLSLVTKKIVHPSYFRIIGRGEPAIPLLLEALRETPAHWFVALSATSNTDPTAPNHSPAQARAAWISWGITNGYID